MAHYRIVLLAFLAHLLLATKSFSQQLPLFNHQQWYRIEDGLPQGFITGIVQDKNGFIWAGTLDGVVRFDGKQFKSYKYQANKKNSLGSNSTSRVVKSKDGAIYVEALESGTVDLLDPSTEKFYRLTSSSWFDELYKRLPAINFNGPVWGFVYVHRLSEVCFVDTATGRIMQFGQGKYLKPTDFVVSPPLQLSDGTWIFASKDAIFELDSCLRKLVRFSLPKSFSFMHRNGGDLSHYFELADGQVLVPAKEGLLRWNRQLNQYRLLPYPHDPGGEQGRFLQLGPDGKCYFAVNDKVYRLEADNSMSLVWQNTVAKGLRITALLIDRTGVMWAGINAAGIVRVNLLSMPFTSLSKDSLFHFQMLTRLGLSSKELPADFVREDGSYAFRYAYDSLRQGHLVAYTISSRNIRPLYFIKNGIKKQLMPGRMPGDYRVSAVATGRGGDIWAYNITTLGLLHWKDVNDTGSFRPLNISKGPQLHSTPYDMVVLGEDLWMSTNGNGLIRIHDYEVIEWFHPAAELLPMPNNLTDICIDPSDTAVLWIGSLGSGLFRFDTRNRKLENITTLEGLPNNTIYCIEPDARNVLWLSTNKGIARFDPTTRVIQSFDKSAGLPGNEFNRSHGFRFGDGNIAFGGTEGAVMLDPLDFSLPENAPTGNLQITSLEVNGRMQVWGEEGSLLKVALPDLQKLALPYNRNFVTIRFASLLFNDPEKIRYRYRLKGVEENWNDAGNINAARYTQLRPGTYTLQLNATGFDGQFANNIRELVIEVLPPYWATWWAYLVYLGVIGATLYTIVQNRKKRYAERMQLRQEHEEAERLRELDKVKERFFGNITHELRTPITLIAAPLEQLSADDSLSPDARKHVHTAINNSERLLRLVNDILEVNKLEAGHLKLQEHVGEPARFFTSCVAKFEARAAEKNINLVKNVESISGYYLFDHEKWETILFNLLSNALKFTPAGGIVAVKADMKAGPGIDTMVLEVSDSGIGIGKAEVEQIFNRFYQTGDKGLNYGGTGIGLALVKELVQLMKGTIEVVSEPGKGTAFIIIAPLHKAAGRDLGETKGAFEEGLAVSMPANEKTFVPEEISAERPVVLVVEDNDELRSYITSALEKQFSIITAVQGADGWTKILEAMPDLVVSDMMMPVMDGNELAKKCKADKRTAHIPFVLLTSRASTEAKLQGLQSGADEYLTKPFHVQELQLRLANLLEQRDRQRKYWQSQMAMQEPTVPSATDAFVQELYQLLDKHLNDQQLGVDLLCRSLGLSASSLQRKLKASLGTGANELIRVYRLKKAAALIRAGYDISHAAYECGFSSPSYFSQRFKEFFGVSPSTYGQ